MLYDPPYFVKVSTVVWLYESLLFPRKTDNFDYNRLKSTSIGQ